MFTVKGGRVLVVFTILALATAPAWGQEKGWEKEWNEILAAAKKEGKVVVAGRPNSVVRRELPHAFRARFGIPLEYIGRRSSGTVSKVMMERRSGLYTVDAFFGGTNTTFILYQGKALDSVREVLILPDALNPSRWKKGKVWFIDPEDKYILRLLYYKSAVLFINTRYVKPEEIKSARDLLSPKWKGKISAFDPTVRGSGTAMMFLHQLGEEFVKRLYVDQRPIISRKTRQLSDWLGRGTYPISLDGSTATVKQMQAEGIPVMNIWNVSDLPGRTTAGTGVVVLVNRAPHPNAARVFVNWIASKEGLEVYARAYGHATTRNDIDEASFLPVEEIPRPGVKYLDVEQRINVVEKERVRSFMKRLLESR